MHFCPEIPCWRARGSYWRSGQWWDWITWYEEGDLEGGFPLLSYCLTVHHQLNNSTSSQIWEITRTVHSLPQRVDDFQSYIKHYSSSVHKGLNSDVPPAVKDLSQHLTFWLAGIAPSSCFSRCWSFKRQVIVIELYDAHHCFNSESLGLWPPTSLQPWSTEKAGSLEGWILFPPYLPFYLVDFGQTWYPWKALFKGHLAQQVARDLEKNSQRTLCITGN